MSNCRKKREEIGCFFENQVQVWNHTECRMLYILTCLYFGVQLESEFWPLVELLAKEEIHSHFSLIIMQFSHRTFENFSSLSCTARDSSSYLVAWNDGQFILSTDWRRVKVWAHPLPQFNLLGSIFYITLRYDFKVQVHTILLSNGI